MSFFSNSICRFSRIWVDSFLWVVGVLMGFLIQSFKATFVAFNFCSHTKEGDPLTGVDQVDFTISLNPSFSIHRGMNLKGMGPKFSSSSSWSKMGLWSKVSFGSVLEDITLWSSSELWTRKRSKRAAIWSDPTLLFVHVNRPLFGLISKRSYCCIISSTRANIWSLPWFPPLFSFGSKTRFRSPATIIFRGGYISMKSARVSQQYFFYD